MLHRSAIETWTNDKWGQQAIQIAEWLIEDDIVQAFVRLQRGALIIDGIIDETGHMRCKNHLHIPFDQWNPGSIQASRSRDSSVRFRHRHAEITLSARFRAPEWGQALLEEWLMEQRGKKLGQKVLNNASPQFVDQKQVLSDTSNNQTLIMLKNCSL